MVQSTLAIFTWLLSSLLNSSASCSHVGAKRLQCPHLQRSHLLPQEQCLLLTSVSFRYAVVVVFFFNIVASMCVAIEMPRVHPLDGISILTLVIK